MTTQYRIASDRFFGMISSSIDEAVTNMSQHPEDFTPDEMVTLTESRGDEGKVIYSGLVKNLTTDFERFYMDASTKALGNRFNG